MDIQLTQNLFSKDSFPHSSAAFIISRRAGMSVFFDSLFCSMLSFVYLGINTAFLTIRTLQLLFNGQVKSDFLWPRGLQHTRLPCPSLSPWVSNFVVSLNNFNLQGLLYINSRNIIAFLTNCVGHSWLLLFCMNLEISLSFSPKEKLKGISSRHRNLRMINTDDVEFSKSLT